MTLDEKLQAVAAAVRGKAWGADIGKPRVYLAARLQHVQVYLDFPKAAADELGTPVLKIHHRRPGKPYPLRKRVTAAEFRALVLAARSWMQKNAVS